MKIPAKLIIKDGGLLLLGESGRSVSEYLKGWQADANLPDGTIVNIISRDSYKKICEELEDQRELIQVC